MPGAVGSLLELEDYDAQWRCRTALAWDAGGGGGSLTHAGHRTPGGVGSPAHSAHALSGSSLDVTPRSARDEPSVEHVLLGQTTCVSRLAQPISDETLAMLQIPIATLPRWTSRKSYSLVVLGPNIKHRRPTTTLSTWAVAVFLFRPQA